MKDITTVIGGTRPITVLTDSTTALNYLTDWQNSSPRMPDGYHTSWRASGQQPALIELQQIAEYTPNLTFTHVKDHAGHPLNEAADSLAKHALRCPRGIVERDRVAELAPL